MVAGSLSESGYFQGGPLHAPRAANPRGFFESAAVNELNDHLLRTVRPSLPGGQGWLSRLGPHELLGTAPPAAVPHLQALTARQPFCLKDPRFSYTLPMWRPYLPSDAGLICVFRHPLLTATSIVEEVHRANYLQGTPLTIDDALSIWASMYHQILHHHRTVGPQPWLFLHYDQMLDGTGPARLGQFLDAEVAANFADRTLRRPPPSGSLPPEIQSLYGALCEQAGIHPSEEPSLSRPSSPTVPDISVIAIIETPSPAAIDRITQSVSTQRGVHAELILVDSTPSGTVTHPSATVVRSAGASRGHGYRAALAVARGRNIALADGRCWRLPNQLARLQGILDAASEVAMVVSDYHISRDGDRFDGHVDLKAAINNPPVGWMSGALLRRAALELASTASFWPTERALLRTLRGVGRLAHLAEPLFSVEAAALSSDSDAVARDNAAIEAAEQTWSGPPALTVSLCTYNRCETLRECLTALCRQNLPAGAFEVTLVNDGSDDGTAGLLDSVTEWPIPVRVLHRANGGLSAARNTGLAATQAPLVLFINDDTIASGDLIAQHLAAHRAHPGGAVLGSFPQPASEMTRNLTHAVETGDLMFCFNMLSQTAANPPQFFYTCNVSVETNKVIAAGGFDESFRHYGAEDTDLGLRLGLQGVTVRYVPAAHAIHRHPYSFDYVRRRAPQVAAAHVRLWEKHPDHIIDAQVSVDRAPSSEALAPYEAAAETLSAVNLDALRQVGLSALADASSTQLITLLRALNGQWWTQGIAAGLREHGYASTDAMLAAHPLAVPEGRRTAWLLVPTTDAESSWVQKVMSYREQFSDSDPVTLVLLAGVEGGYSASGLAEGLQIFEAADAPHVSIVETGLPPRHAIRLFAAVDGWIPTGAPADAHWAELAAAGGCPHVEPSPTHTPWPLATSSRHRLLAWPSWSNADLHALLSQYGASLSGQPDVTLCLRLDPQSVPDLPGALQRLQTIAEQVLPQTAELDILVVEDDIPDNTLHRLGKAVDGLLALPSNPDPEALGRILGIPVIHGSEGLQARLRG